MKEKEPRTTITLRTSEGEVTVIEGRGAMILTVDHYNGNPNMYSLKQAFYGDIKPVHVARQILRDAEDKSTSQFADFWREVVAYITVALAASRGGEDISELLGGITAEEAFARDAIDRAEGRV